MDNGGKFGDSFNEMISKSDVEISEDSRASLR